MANELNLNIKTTILDGNDNAVVKDQYAASRASVTERVYKRYAVADLVTDQQIVLDSVNAANFLMIRSDQDITVKIGGTEAARAIELKAALTGDDDATVRALFMATIGNDTLIYVSNSSGSAANVEVILL